MFKAAYHAEKLTCELQGKKFDEKKFWISHVGPFIIMATGFIIVLCLILSSSCTDAPMAPTREKLSNVVILEVDRYNNYHADSSLVSVTLWNDGQVPAWHVVLFYQDPGYRYIKSYPGTIQVHQLHEFVFKVPMTPECSQASDYKISVEYEDYGY